MRIIGVHQVHHSFSGYYKLKEDFGSLHYTKQTNRKKVFYQCQETPAQESAWFFSNTITSQTNSAERCEGNIHR